MLHFPLHLHLGWGAVCQAPCLPMVGAHPWVGRQRGPQAAGCKADSMSPLPCQQEDCPAKPPLTKLGLPNPVQDTVKGKPGAGGVPSTHQPSPTFCFFNIWSTLRSRKVRKQ